LLLAIKRKPKEIKPWRTELRREGRRNGSAGVGYYVPILFRRFIVENGGHGAKSAFLHKVSFFETVRNWVCRNCSGRIGLDRTPAGCEQNRPCWIDRGFRP
jgi:hypothetical protein